MPDIETLRLVWWLLLGFLFIGFALTDGFDLGIEILLPLIAKNDEEKRTLIRVIEPVWEGNQVWIILGAGSLFAAWPYVYAIVFSGAYFYILLLLLSMGIARPVSIKYRSKLANSTWRQAWDTVFFLGGFLPAVIFGLLIGNLLQGLPFHLDDTLRIVYDGGFTAFLNSFACWCALTSVVMLTMYGGLYLAIKTLSPIQERAVYWAKLSALLLIILYGAGSIWMTYLPGYQVQGGINPLGYSNPLNKHVVSLSGAWLMNYSVYPQTLIVPAAGCLGALGAFFTAGTAPRLAFICSGLSLTGIIGSVGVSMFPFIVPSSTQLSSSLLIWDASSSRLTLLIMLAGTIIFMPIILAYTTWVYSVLRGKVEVRK